MPVWKKLFLRTAGFGAGFATILCMVLGGWIWYHSRPTPTRPWNSTAIKGEFDSVETEGAKNTLVFVYFLENTTNTDYRLSSGGSLQLRALLGKQNDLAEPNDIVSLHLPVFVPAKTRAQILIHVALAAPYTEHTKPPSDDADKTSWATYRKAVAEFVTKDMSNLDGFTIFDEAEHYEIRLPKGW